VVTLKVCSPEARGGSQTIGSPSSSGGGGGSSSSSSPGGGASSSSSGGGGGGSKAIKIAPVLAMPPLYSAFGPQGSAQAKAGRTGSLSNYA